MITFDGKVAIITGAAGVIGGATARCFFNAGACLVLTDVSGEGVETFAAELDPSGERIATMAQDARSSADADAAAELAAARFGGVDTLVTAAGIYPQVAVTDMTDAEWDDVVGINLDGVLYASRAAIPVMNDGGSMVHIASLAAHRGSAQHAHYAAAKAGVLGFTRSLAYELAPRDIRVNAVSPGLIDTPMITEVMSRRGDLILASTPMARVGTADEVASGIAFLASDLASFVTGETLHINGGFYMGS